MKCPCKGCKFRAVGCHSVCKNYQEYHAEMDKRRKERLKKSEIADYCVGQSIAISKRRNTP